MGMDVPKQYLSLNNITVLEASLSCFLHHPQVAAVVVALPVRDARWSKMKVSSNRCIHTVEGGPSRAQTVLNALETVHGMAGTDDYVLVHDAARPCLDYSDLDRLICAGLASETGAILATPVCDTIKQVRSTGDDREVVQTVDRSSLWKALTPQMFRVPVLDEALRSCLKDSRVVTDDASAVEAVGHRVNIIEGRSDNIKITRPEDIRLAESIMRHIKNQPG